MGERAREHTSTLGGPGAQETRGMCRDPVDPLCSGGLRGDATVKTRSRILVAALAVGALAIVSNALAAPVLTTPANERNPAAAWNAGGTTEYLAWSQNSAGAPNHYDAYVRTGTAAPVKLNVRGQGWTGGIDGSTGQVVFQRVLSGQSDLKLYDLSSGAGTPFAHTPNTAKWEWHPTISGDDLLFNRDDVSTPTQRVYLHILSTGVETRLDMTTAATSTLYAGQVNGSWAVWTKCNPTCKVYRWHIGVSTRPELLPAPAVSPTPQQYGAGVTSGGVVYLGRSGKTCGSNVKIVRYFGSGDPATGTVLWMLTAGRDFVFGFARENPGSSVDYFYDRVACSTNRWDVFKVTDP